jgi:mitogen-activated protein kinase organizer 1
MESVPYREHSSMEGHKGAVLVCRFNSDGTYCMSGGKDRKIILWNPHKGTQVKEYDKTHGYEVLDIKIMKDNSKFASGGGDKTFFLWDVSTGKTLRRIRGHDGRINTLSFNDDENVLVSGSYDRTVRCWDLRSNLRDPIQTIADHRDSVTSVVVKGSQIFSSSVDGCMRIYDVRMATRSTDHIASAITSLSLSNDSNCILLSCMDSTVRLFDKSTGELLNKYKSHVNEVYKVESCMSNTDAHVVSGSEDHCIYFWNLVEGNVIHTLRGHSRPVISVSYHPKETCLLSASVDGTVKCWK